MRDEHSKELKKFLARVCSRQETFFKGLKDWKILKFRFTYGRSVAYIFARQAERER